MDRQNLLVSFTEDVYFRQPTLEVRVFTKNSVEKNIILNTSKHHSEALLLWVAVFALYQNSCNEYLGFSLAEE